MKYCGVVGNPVEHSRSPSIHQHFAQQFGLKLSYEKLLSSEQEFAHCVEDFFSRQGCGLNVTLPFKQSAAKLCQQLSQEAQLCQSVKFEFKF